MLWTLNAVEDFCGRGCCVLTQMCFFQATHLDYISQCSLQFDVIRQLNLSTATWLNLIDVCLFHTWSFKNSCTISHTCSLYQFPGYRQKIQQGITRPYGMSHVMGKTLVAELMLTRNSELDFLWVRNELICVYQWDLSICC